MGGPGFDHATARKMRWAGHSLSDIGRALGVSHVSVYHVCKDIPVRVKTGPKSRNGKSHSVETEAAASTSIGHPKVEVPCWVSSRGLGEEYRKIAYTQGEFAAASHCRALLREMTAGA